MATIHHTSGAPALQIAVRQAYAALGQIENCLASVRALAPRIEDDEDANALKLSTTIGALGAAGAESVMEMCLALELLEVGLAEPAG